MKILLVKPNKKSSFYCLPPMGLAYVAGNLERNGFETDIYDAYKEDSSDIDVEKKISEKEYDIIGFECFPNDVDAINRYIRIAKRLYPKIVSVIGGPFPSSAPEIAMNEIKADYGIKGEGEEAMRAFVNNLNQEGTIKDPPGLINLIYREGDKTKVSKIQFEDYLDKFGIPAWGKIPLNTYPESYQGAFAKNTPVGYIESKRGCPYSCTFCATTLANGKKIRRRSVDLIIKDLDYQVKHFGIKEFHVRDDEFTIDRKDVIDFCEKLLKKEYKLSWNLVNGVRLDSLDEEMLILMKRAGCYAMHVGIEAGSQKVLNNIRKDLTKEQIRDKVELIVDHGIDVVGLFIIGIPGETKEDIKETLAFSKKLRLSRAQFGIFLPLPGTQIFQELIRDCKLRLEDINWEEYDAYRHVIYHSDLISDAELKNLQRYAFLSFYLRPRIMMNFLKDINSPNHLKNLVIRMVNFIR